MTIRSITLTAALLFMVFVAHAAYRESTTCPVVGKCAAIHLQLMQAPDWSDAPQATAHEPIRVASH